MWQRHRGLSADDWILASYPKSGGTWLAFMLGEVLLETEINFGNQGDLLPAVGHHHRAATVPGSTTRIIRTHERPRKEYGRAIYLVRHVADVAVSYHRWLSWLGIDDVGFDEFLREFLAGTVDGWGPWQAHVSSWLQQTSTPVIVVRYEDLRHDTEGTLGDVLDRMGLSPDPERLRTAVANNSVDRMRRKEEEARRTVFRSRNPNAHFVRNGKTSESAEMLRSEHLELVERFAGSTLSKLGYDLIPSAT